MKTFQASTLIRATPAAIWKILTDAPGYPDWNTTVSRVDGTIAEGQKITVHAVISPGRSFPVRVTSFTPEKQMVWTGGMPFGLFQGQRTFTLKPKSDGLVEFGMVEVFDGLLSPLMERSLPDLQPAFLEFAGALRKRAEATN